MDDYGKGMDSGHEKMSMGGSEMKPETGIGRTLPAIDIGEPNSGRNYPAAIDKEAMSNTVGGMSHRASYEAKDTKI